MKGEGFIILSVGAINQQSGFSISELMYEGIYAIILIVVFAIIQVTTGKQLSEHTKDFIKPIWSKILTKIKKKK